MTNHELNAKLKSWAAASHTGMPENTAALVTRVQAAVRRQGPAQGVGASRVCRLGNRAWPGRLGWAMAGVAVGVLVGLLWPRVPADTTGIVQRPADETNWPWNGRGEREATALTGQLAALFGPALNGYLETSHNLTLAVAPEAVEPASRRWVRVEFALFHRAGGSEAWTPTWHAAAVVRAEERVELRTEGGTQLVLWALPVNGDGVLVESQMDLKTPPFFLRHEGSDLCRRGLPTRMLQVDDAAGTYRLMIRAQTTPVNSARPSPAKPEPSVSRYAEPSAGLAALCNTNTKSNR